MAQESDLDNFRNKLCCLPWTDSNYKHPEPNEVAELIKLAGWSQNDAAKIVGVSFDVKRGSSTIRKWKSDKGQKDHRPIPYSAWRLLLIHAGLVRV